MRTVTLAVLVGCGPHVIFDAGDPCFTAPLAAPGELVVEVTFLGGEQPPRDPLCQIEAEGDDLRLRTDVSYARDRTPFTELSILTMATASCAVALDAAGAVTVRFGDEVFEIAVPGDGEPVCPLREG
ncbi:MAG TPA: hypothetical protein PKA64_06645 [Myxococcota bacterium]|nr:hypothetical protein [Myxococcota bacterium]